MKIALVIDETFFFHPKYVEDICQKYKDEIDVVFLVTKIKKKNSLEKYLIRNIFYLTLNEIFILSFIKMSKIIRDFFYRNFKLGNSQSVYSTLKKYNIKIFKVHYDLNTQEVYDCLIKNKVKLIISSNSLFFGKKILNIPNLVCINRHSSYLPMNAGLWPAFYSISNELDYTGTTIHIVNEKIDTGKIISQKKINIFSKNLFDLYKECYKISSELTFEAIIKLTNNSLDYQKNVVNEVVYNSFPKREDWKKFRKNGGKFVSWNNLFY